LRATVLALAAFFAFTVQAVAAQEPRIGFVDIPFVIDKAPQAEAAGKRLEEQFAPRQQALQDQAAELQGMRQRLEKDALIMTDTQRGELEADILKLDRRLKRDEQFFREELNIQKNNEFKKVRVVVLKAIDRYSRSNGYDLVLSEGVLFASKRVDLTEGVLDELRRMSQEPGGSQ
jgi:outer membrane protein